MNKKKLGTDGLPIPVVDIFAGPGGLGEGFSQAGGESQFKVTLSIEMETSAHRTLRLRAFQRQLTKGNRIPSGLLDVARGVATERELELEFPRAWEEANKEARRYELGPDNHKIYEAIRIRLGTNRIKSGRWILIGGPPCQAYSIAGRARNSRARRTGEYQPENDHRHFLYKQYLEILAQFRPAVFVMENVKGMLSAKINGFSMFEKILADLRHPAQSSGTETGLEYNLYSVSSSAEECRETMSPASFIVESENFGIPQRRHRVIIVGIRSDFYYKSSMLLLQKNSEVPTCWDAISDLPPIRSRLSRRVDSLQEWLSVISGADWRRLIGVGTRGRIPSSDHAIYEGISKYCANLFGMETGGDDFGAPVLRGRESPGCGPLASWYGAEGNAFVFNHEARFHMDSDLWRYLYLAVRSKIEGISPKLCSFPRELLPAHLNVDESIRSKSLFADRFRVQVPNQPSTTITSHIAKDGHGFIHYDPSQCRTLTVREAARLQTFPDDYCFLGTRSAQYRQVGNAVPPYLAIQISEAIAKACGLSILNKGVSME